MQEATRNAREPLSEGHPVDDRGSGHDRAHDLIRDVLECPQVDAGVEADFRHHRDERFHLAVTGSRPGPGQTRVGQRGALFKGDDRVRHSQRQVLVRVDPGLGLASELGEHRGDPGLYVIHRERPGRVHDVHAGRAGIDIMRARRAIMSGVVMCGIIKSPCTSMPRSLDSPMCWMAMSASVQWVAILTRSAPSSAARSSCFLVPMPGWKVTASRARLIAFLAAVSNSSSVCSERMY